MRATRAVVAAAVVLTGAAPVRVAATPADAVDAEQAWIVTVAPGADVELDGRAIGPRDVAVVASPAEAAELASRTDVVAVEPDQPARAADLPDDPCLTGVECPVAGDQSALLRIGAATAWPVASDAPDVVVAVIDAGVDANHPDLAGRVIPVPPGPGGCAALPTSLGIEDRTVRGHGTRVAGIIAAAADGRGSVGVVPGAVQLRAYTALAPDLRGATSDVVAAVHCAIDDGVDVINLSLTAGSTTAMHNALDRAEAAGVVVVAAAGNGGNGAHPGTYPAAHPSVIGVTAVVAADGGERRAAFADGGPWVDLAAPGTGVLSTTPGGGWSVAAGTSYAAPMVTGAVALLLGRAPELRPAAVRERLAETAEPLADPTAGRGLVDLSAAVRFPVAEAPACAARAGWVLDAFGGLHAVGGAPAVAASGYWQGWDIARDLAAVRGRDGGYVLDGYGALHPFGGAPRLLSPAYRPGWDIARAAELRADGSVVVLDGQGGLHVAGGGAPIGAGGPWWPGEDVARDLAVDPAEPSRVFVLDAFGGVHLAGAGEPAPRVVVGRYTPGQDLARRLVVLPDGERGYVLDAAGGLHPWALAGTALPEPRAVATATGTGRGAALDATGEVIAVDAAGSVVSTGDAPCRPGPRWPGQDAARALALR